MRISDWSSDVCSSDLARALEVVRSTGKPLADWQATRRGGIGDRIALKPLVLLPDLDWLFARCDARFEAMLDPGAVDEVRRLRARSDPPAAAPQLGRASVRERVGQECSIRGVAGSL